MFNDDDETPIQELKVLTAFENSYNNYTRAGTFTQGWFKAPETGNFKFYISCDDYCRLNMDSSSPWNKAAPQEPTLIEIARKDGASTGFRNYFMTPNPEGNQYISEWIALTKGEFYKIEAKHLEYGGSDDLTVSVEFEKEDTTGHHHAAKEIQILSIDPENV